jgi:hypothetical protein
MFKDTDVKKLTVVWRFDKRAWISYYVRAVTCHLHTVLSDIQFVWFLPNTASVSELIDQEVIKCVKLKKEMKATYRNSRSHSLRLCTIILWLKVPNFDTEVERGAAVKETKKFVKNHQQSKEDKDDEK